jgi:HTH-type transcriptional regulator / antitoxin HigA
MMSTLLEQTKIHWTAVKDVLSIPRTEQEYDHIVSLLNELVDTVGEDENHPLADLMETLSVFIEIYDQIHYPQPTVSGAEVLSYLMHEHGLKQTDLRHEIGTQGVVSEILNGKRALNVRQIQALAERFQVSPATFL